MVMGLFLDDERIPEQVTWCKLPNIMWAIARNDREFKQYIENHGVPKYLSFDHDLGLDSETGYESLKWLVNYMLDQPDIRIIPSITFHSQNQIGVDAMRQYWKSFLDHF